MVISTPPPELPKDIQVHVVSLPRDPVKDGVLVVKPRVQAPATDQWTITFEDENGQVMGFPDQTITGDDPFEAIDEATIPAGYEVVNVMPNDSNNTIRVVQAEEAPGVESISGEVTNTTADPDSNWTGTADIRITVNMSDGPPRVYEFAGVPVDVAAGYPTNVGANDGTLFAVTFHVTADGQLAFTAEVLRA